MNKKFIQLFVFLILTFAVTGCGKVISIKRTINADGTGIDEITIKEETIDEEEVLTESFENTKTAMEDRNINPIARDGEIRFTNIFEDVSKTALEDEDEELIFEKKNDGFKYKHKINIKGIIETVQELPKVEFLNSEEENPKQLTVSITMPGNITETNANVKKGREATWNVDISKLKNQALVFEAVCGAPVQESKADEQRYKKLVKQQKQANPLNKLPGFNRGGEDEEDDEEDE